METGLFLAALGPAELVPAVIGVVILGAGAVIGAVVAKFKGKKDTTKA